MYRMYHFMIFATYWGICINCTDMFCVVIKLKLVLDESLPV